jgi:hypothetical protein
VKKWLSFILCIALIMTSIVPLNAVPSFASGSDYSDHWAKSYIEQAKMLGFVKGYPDGSVKPDVEITRAEFFSMVNNAFSFSETKAILFSDVKDNNWFYSAVQKASAAGYTSGYPDNSMRPNNNIQRQEVASVLQKVTGTENKATKVMFTDAAKIPTWSLKSIISVFESKIMSGYPDGSFMPEAPITRSEAMVAILNAINVRAVVYDQAGTYGAESTNEVVNSSVVIKASGVTLQNITINGNLTIAEEVGNGDVTLTNIIVMGDTFIRGGGANTIYISGGSYNKITIEKTSSDRVRIVAKDVEGLEVIISEDASGENIILEGSFKNVIIAANDVEVETRGLTKIEALTIEAGLENVKLEIGSTTTISRMTIKSEAEIMGLGTILQANVYANGVSFEQEPESLFVESGIEDPEIIQTILPPAGGGGSGGGGGSTGEDDVIIQKTYINGTISLPATDVAPEGGIQLKVSAVDSEAMKIFNSIVTIPENKSSAEYSIEVPKGSYVIRYSEEKTSYYVNEGYYCGTETNVDFVFAQNIIVDIKNVTGINMTIIRGKAISGEIFLPNSEVAPQGGLLLRISAEHNIINKNVTIPEGQNSVDYKIIVPEGDYYINYQTLNNTDYVYRGYYSTNGTVYDHDYATILSVLEDDIPDINIELIKGYEISGILTLPNGEVTPVGGIEVQINFKGESIFSTHVRLESGTLSAPFSIRVTPGTYVISYFVYNSDDFLDGFYNNTGTVIDSNLASEIEVFGDVFNIGIELLRGYAISGTVFLQNGEVVSDEGVDVRIVAEANGYVINDTLVYIPKGANSTEYSVLLPPGVYNLKYESNSSEIISKGYYSDSGTVFFENISSDISAINMSIQNINIELFKGNLINGIVSLPNGETAPEDGIEVMLQALGNYDFYNKQIIIESGNSQADYSIRVPSDDYRLHYSTSSSDYVKHGYLSDNGVINDEAMATVIHVSNEDVYDKNIELIKGVRISGLVSLPDGLIELGTTSEIWLTVVGDNYESSYTVSVTIPNGEIASEYSVRVPSGTYKLKYLTWDTNFVREGYYSNNGTVIDSTQASEIIALDEEISNINIDLFRGLKISGILSLPGGEVAPSNGIEVRVILDGSSNPQQFFTFTISEGDTSVEYSIQVLPGEYILEYHTRSTNYVSNGYYSESGTVTDSSMASMLILTEEDTTERNIELLKGFEISGMVVLPDGEIAPADGIPFNVSAAGLFESYGTSIITMPSGKSFKQFVFRAPLGIYTLSCTVWNDSGFVSDYNSEIQVNDDITNIIIQLERYNPNY